MRNIPVRECRECPCFTFIGEKKSEAWYWCRRDHFQFKIKKEDFPKECQLKEMKGVKKCLKT